MIYVGSNCVATSIILLVLWLYCTYCIPFSVNNLLRLSKLGWLKRIVTLFISQCIDNIYIYIYLNQIILYCVNDKTHYIHIYSDLECQNKFQKWILWVQIVWKSGTISRSSTNSYIVHFLWIIHIN